ALFVFAAATAPVYGQGTSMRVETFSLRPNGAIVVENPRGSVRVESWNNQTVRVIAEKKAPVGSSIEPGELTLMVAQNSIIVQCKAGRGRIDLTLYVPNNAQVDVTGGAFAVDITGSLTGAVVDTTSGSINYRLPVNDDAQVEMHSGLGAVRSSVPLTAV